MEIIFSAWTVVVFVLFMAIVCWAWSGKNKDKFEEAARMPLDDDDDVPPEHYSSQHNNNGDGKNG